MDDFRAPQRQRKRVYYNGRIVVDPAMMLRNEAENTLIPSIRAFRTKSRKCISNNTHTNAGLVRAILSDSSVEITPDEELILDERQRKCERPCQDCSSQSNCIQMAARGLTSTDRLLLSGKIYGYCIGDQKWSMFTVGSIQEVVWDDAVLGCLVIPEKTKRQILDLIKVHVKQSSPFDDFVRGKGRGLVCLLYGQPGLGKTMTAEAIAESTRKPLITVSSGTLGEDSYDVRNNLVEVFELATRWEAILLLDEADVFLSQRDEQDISRNAIVSVFLHELEYFSGTILLTSNRVESIDPAFRSRIHFYHYYEPLDTFSKASLWTLFIKRCLNVEDAAIDMETFHIDHLAKFELNGREIKNAISIATKLAMASGSQISYGILMEAIQCTQNHRRKTDDLVKTYANPYCGTPLKLAPAIPPKKTSLSTVTFGSSSAAIMLPSNIGESLSR
ncbi:ATPase-like protein 9 [Elsinoe fawcettii]|nr:ATPase-like protein 9 [Elsinoe fawcettii]